MHRHAVVKADGDLDREPPDAVGRSVDTESAAPVGAHGLIGRYTQLGGLRTLHGIEYLIAHDHRRRAWRQAVGIGHHSGDHAHAAVLQILRDDLPRQNKIDDLLIAITLRPRRAQDIA